MARQDVVALKLRLPVETHERLRDWAALKGKSLNSVLCAALEAAGKPREREIAAISILKRQMLDASLAVAKPGEGAWEIEHRADQLLQRLLDA